MNIFEQEINFIGEFSTAQFKMRYNEFFKTANLIRNKLGKRAYILDNYITYLFEAVNNTLTHDTSQDGLNKIHEHRMMIADIQKSKESEYPLSEKALSVIENNPISFQESYTLISYYCLKMVGDILEYSIDSFKQQELDNLNGFIDIIQFNEYYKNICSYLESESEMELLNVLFRDCFITVTRVMALLILRPAV